MSSGDTTVTYSAETGAVVARVRPTLLAALLAVSEQDLVDSAKAWSHTEEAVLDGLGPVELVPVVRDLVGLARTADVESSPVYCWMSP